MGGQDVFHAHLHVTPRFAEEHRKGMTYRPPLAGKGLRFHLKQRGNASAQPDG